ncbi:MAG: DNA primase [Patescibacteria group bacterium]
MDVVEDIKSRLDIADLVGEYLQLKPAGSGSFKANCPFHQEKTPSFFVNRPRQSWHCFGCDIGGDVISFVQKMEGMEFPEALEHLAQKVGVELPRFDSRLQSDKKRLFEINDLAARFFRSVLLTQATAQHARDYVNKRGLDELTCDIWRIGYAPQSWTALSEALAKRDVKEDELIKVGLCLKSEKNPGIYDRFRDRLMFPICDIHGNATGFTGRLLSDSKEAKYVNTPETFIYKKSSILFGLDKAKGVIKRQDLAVIVEGNMDVISSHQFKITNVVASSGTALTGEQLGLLKRFTTNLAIAFDADSAGKAATIRGLDIARALDFNVKIITLPPEVGKDPDDAVRKDPEIWRQAIHNALPVVEWLYRNAFKGKDPSKPEGKKQIARELLTEFLRIADSVERDAWITRLAKDLDVSTDSLRDALKNTRRTGSTEHESRSTEPSIQSTEHESRSTEHVKKPRETELAERILAILYLKPELRDLAQKSLPLYNLPDLTSPDLLNFIAILADREFQNQSLQALTDELMNETTSLHELLRTKKRTDLENQMREAERIGDNAKIQDLLSQFNQLI